MKRILFLTAIMLSFFACGNKAKPVEPNPELATDTVTAADNRQPFHKMSHRDNCIIVISKLNLTLRVYEARTNDTVLIAEYPVCMGKNRGDKTRSGDMKTPESTLAKPFTITEIKDASTWTHDFKDGRGAILAYGNWFMRLSYGSGIGIHGSTNNEGSVPGRASEGCIRLRDVDIIALKENYAFKGMKVVIKGEEEGPLSFEQ